MEDKDKRKKVQDVEDLFRKVFESANDGIIIHDSAGQIYEVNRTMHRRLGYTREEMLNMGLQDLVAPGFGEKIRERVGRRGRTG